MRIVEIAALDNGGHRNMTYHNGGTVPEGWAIVPDTLSAENFPFGNLTVDQQTPPVVLSWEPLPYPVAAAEETPAPTTEDILNALLGGDEHE